MNYIELLKIILKKQKTLKFSRLILFHKIILEMNFQ